MVVQPCWSALWAKPALNMSQAIALFLVSSGTMKKNGLSLPVAIPVSALCADLSTSWEEQPPGALDPLLFLVGTSYPNKAGVLCSSYHGTEQRNRPSMLPCRSDSGVSAEGNMISQTGSASESGAILQGSGTFGG